jgi:hypothetical protein
MKDITSKFEQFYKKKHQNRNLKWLFHHGKTEVKPLYVTDKNYTFVCNCYQTVIMMMFNRSNVLTLNQIKEATSIPEEDLLEALKYFCNPKFKVLNKQFAKTPVFKPDETIEVNLTFKNANLKLSLVPLMIHKKKDDQKSDQDKKHDDDIRLER